MLCDKRSEVFWGEQKVNFDSFVHVLKYIYFSIIPVRPAYTAVSV